jgi:hypothetical protein
MSYDITWTRVWTLYTPPLAGLTCASFSPGPQETANRGPRIWKNTALVMSSPQPDGMNRYKTNHTQPNQPRKETRITPHPSRRRAHQPGPGH